MRTGTRGSTWNIFRNSFSSRRIGAPIDRAQIVAVMEMAMVQKLLPAAREARAVMAAHQAVERFLPVNRQTLQLLQKLAVEQGSGWHGALMPRKRARPLRG